MDIVEESGLDYDFADDFLYFYEGRTSEVRSDGEADLVRRLIDHRADRSVLDLACGSGRIANRLAASGGRVVGIDAAGFLVDRARRQAEKRGVAAEYLQGDMRDIDWREEFDAIVSWYTSFGYFDDSTDQTLLERCRRALRPNGQLLLELNNRDELLRNYLPSIVVRRGDDILVDENRFDPLTGRTNIRRTILRGKRVTRAEFSIRLFCFNEIRDWLLRAGFARVDVCSGDGGEFHPRSPRMILLARK